jgi:hypothetical protein
VKYYLLDDDHHIRVTRDVLEWAAFFENYKGRIVEQTRFECGVLVSTVFLGLDHRYVGKGPPLLFETMVFELTMDGDGDQWRYASWDDAEAGHRAAVRRAKALLEKAGLSTIELKQGADS